MTVDIWKSDFGNKYTERNQSVDGRLGMWTRILRSLPETPKSILEVGANIGINLSSINNIINTKLVGLEPNEKARSQLPFNSISGTADSIPLKDNSVEMVFTCGVLIHIPDIKKSCDEIYRVSSKYIVCIEYFNDKLIEIPYRGESGMLWKQDFGKFWMNNYDLNLLDYGFFWKEATGLDNLTFWIFEKQLEKP